MQTRLLKVLALSAVTAGVITACTVAAYMLGQKHVRDRYEIWYSSSATFEARLVDASQNAQVYARIHSGDIDGADDVLLGRLGGDLDVVHALISIAPERDRSMAEKVIKHISETIGERLPGTNAASSDYRTALRVSRALKVKRQLEFFTNAKANQTNTVTP